MTFHRIPVKAAFFQVRRRRCGSPRVWKPPPKAAPSLLYRLGIWICAAAVVLTLPLLVLVAVPMLATWILVSLCVDDDR